MDYGDAPDTNLKPSTGGSKTKHVSFTEVVSIVNSDHDCGSRPHSETNPKGIGDGSAQLSNSSSAVLSTSSRSSSDDPVLPNFRVHNYIPKPKSLYKNDKLNLSSEALNKLEESISGSQESTSQCSDITHESNSCVSPTLSPPIQVMDRAGGFDPDRIPDSIFSRPLSTPPDWSAASNDSLFSIRIGNTSFPREYTPRMGSDFCKSGELPKSGEASKSGELCQSGEPFEARESCESGEPHKSKELPQSGALNKSKESHHSREHSDLKRSGELARCRTYPPTEGVETDKKLDMAKTVHEDIKPGERGLIDGPANDVPKALMNNQVERKVRESRDSSSANRHSDKSEISNPSCALPTKKKSSCLLCHFPDCCHCPDCCRVSCCCKWSACSFKRFLWPSCFRNCLSWKRCCCKWPSCHCKCFSWSSCRCKCLSWSSCCCKCPTWPSCTCCTCPTWPSCTCCTCPTWPSCTCKRPSCTWSCCYFWKRKPKGSTCDSSSTLPGGGITTSKKGKPEHQQTTPPNPKSSSRRRCSCFTCSPSCSCCSCWPRSCCH